MDYCSRITVGHNTKIVLQHISSSPLLACNTISFPSLSCNTISFLTLQVIIQSKYCNTILATAHPLQYNLLCCNTILATTLSCNTLCCVAIQSFMQYNIALQPAIQFCIATQPRQFLQYNSSYSSLLLYNTKIVLQYNFHYNFFFPAFSLAIQLQGCNTNFILFFTRQLGSSPKMVFALFFFLLLETPKNTYT